uniref:DUF727 domain-containing protein n=1 Tax=Parastrongyloides trichosuri TaxID=131310 RepID=A0A0N4ZCT4_PARTI
MSFYKSLEDVHGNPCSRHSLNAKNLSETNSIPLTNTPLASGVNANFLANSLGVSPLYKQYDSARWQTAANVFNTSRVQSPISAQLIVSGNMSSNQNLTIDNSDNMGPMSRQMSHLLIHQIGNTAPTPINLAEIAAANRRAYYENEPLRVCELAGGPLELEAIASVHELASLVKLVSVSEMLPRTSDLIFVNIKTVEDIPYTLELTMKGWRVASLHTDSMNGDYNQVDLHTRYFDDVRELIEYVSPGCKDYLNQLLSSKLSQLSQDSSKNEDDEEKNDCLQDVPSFKNLVNKPVSLRSFSAPMGDSKECAEVRTFLDKQMK